MIASLKKIAPSFVISYLSLLLFPSFFPQMRLLAFAPFLTYTAAHCTLPITLWLSMLSGLIVDLYSKSSPMGFFALNHTLTTVIIYRYRSYFTFEKIPIFSLFTTLFSFISTLVHFLLFALIEMQFKLHIFSILTDLLLMPIIDGVYSLVLVFFPIKVTETLTQPQRLRKMKRKALILRHRALTKLYQLGFVR